MTNFTHIKKIISISILIFTFCSGYTFATDYPGTWTSVTQSNTALNSLSNYTLVATNPTSGGNITANSYVPAGKVIVVAFPSGYTLNTVSGGSVNGIAISSSFTTNATTVTFNTPVAIEKLATITIVLNDITNSATSGCYQLSMKINNETGTGTGFQNLFTASLNSQYTLGSGLCYCTSNASSTIDSYIGNVTFNSINNSSTACTGYSDFTNVSTSVDLGLSYTLTITKGTCGGIYTGRFAAWIDWNLDGVFDASEKVLSDAVASNGPVSVSVTVPTGASPGNSRMRCVFVEGTTIPSMCGTYTYGETEDYTITIDPLIACSGTPNAGTTTINPTSSCTGAMVNLSSTGSSLNGGLTYQWQKSTNSGSTWSNIGPSMTNTPSNYSDSPTASCTYRLYVICSNSGISSTSNVETFTLTSGTLSVKTWIGKGAGGTGTNFNTAANWNPASTPVPCDSIRIILNSAAVITMSANATIGALVYSVSGGVTCELDVQTRLLTINNTSTYDASGSSSSAQVNVKSSGAGIINNGNCIFHNSGTGITYLYAATANPGIFQLNANLIVGTGGRTSPAVEPKLIFDAPVAQSWISNNTATYFLGEDVIFGLTNSPEITMGGGAYTTLAVYDGNVQINNSTLVKAMNCTIDRYTGAGTFTMASGSKLELNNSNDLPTSYTFVLNANSTIEYLGIASSQSINGITYGHLIIGGSGTKSAIANSVIQGNFLIRSGAVYQAANSATVLTHNFHGNFTNDGTFTSNASFPSTFIMNGTIDQFISGAVSSTFYNLTINKSTGVGFLGNNTQVGTTSVGAMAFTNGPLNLNAYKLTINNPATNAVTRSTGYAISENVNNASKVQWNMGATIGSHIFPFGTSTGFYVPFTFNLTAGTIGNVTVSTYPTATDNTPYPFTPNLVTNINGSGGLNNSANTVDRFWQIDKTGVSGTATLTFIATPAEVGSIASLLAQRWNTSTSIWEAPLSNQISQLYGTTVPDVSNFSPWTLSGNDMPLPIELLSFEARYNENVVDLLWSTASEFNNDYFSIERTVDGVNYTLIKMIKGAGNSNSILEYKTVDQEPYNGLAYYRLKQTDYDGKAKYSQLEAIYINHSIGAIEIYPNPAESSINILYNSDSDGVAVLHIMDASGRLVYTSEIKSLSGKNSVNVDVLNFSNGMYLATLKCKNEVVNTKFIKE